MRYAGKILSGLIAAIIVTAAMSAVPFTAPAVNAYASGRASGQLAYDHIMSAPVAVTSDGERAYVLDANGDITILDGNETHAFDGTVVYPYGDAADPSAADKTAVLAGTVYLYDADTVAAISRDSGIYELTSDGVRLRTDAETVSSVPVTVNGSITGGAADENELYVIVSSGSRLSLYAYPLTGGEARTVVLDLPADGSITAAAFVGGVFYYATDYTLYSLDEPGGYDTRGGITSMTEYDGKLLFSTRAGRIYSYDGETTGTVLGSSEKISVASRRNTVAFADKGNNRVTVMHDGNTEVFSVDRPNSVAVSYTGNIYVASDDGIVGIPDGNTVFSSDEIVTDICFDYERIDEDVIYAVSESGSLTDATDGTEIATGIVAAAPHPDGGVFALGADGSVTHYAASGDGYSAVSSFSARSGSNDIDADRKGNVYVLSSGTIYKYAYGGDGYGTGSAINAADPAAAIEISETEFTSDGYAVGYGDIIAVGSHSGRTDIIPASDAGTDMLNGDAYSEAYREFEADNFTDDPNASDTAANIAITTIVTEVYSCPVEMPSENGEIAAGTYVILIARYGDSDYWYAIAESEQEGSLVGYVNINATETCAYMTAEETEAAYGTDLRRYAYGLDKSIKVYKYPSSSAPVVLASASVDASGDNHEFMLASFVSGYKDENGNEWYRVVWQKADGDDTFYDGYMPEYSLTKTSGDQTEPDCNGEINVPGREYAECYELSDGEYVLTGETIANGTPVEIIGNYTKAEEYTHIRYKDDGGTVRDCYVLTGDVRQTEAGWYQVVMFVVGGVVIVFLAILVIVFIKRKRKID